VPTPARSSDLALQAKFVFQGTVLKLKTTNLADVPATDRTVLVRVDQIIQASETLTDFAGHEVTVQLAPGEKVKAGQSFVFYTNGWVFGEHLGVQSVGHEEATGAMMAALSSHPGDPVRSLESRQILSQAADADLIVSGRVSSVRLPAHEAAARAAAVSSGGGSTVEPISEHAPMWQEAVVDVDEVHHGKHSGKQVTIRFPSSTDVRWHNAPKFHAGQEGVFLLHKQQAATGTRKAVAATAVATGPGEYTALHPADVQPLDELQRILTAVKSGNS
jgi:hypothetical protein